MNFVASLFSNNFCVIISTLPIILHFVNRFIFHYHRQTIIKLFITVNCYALLLLLTRVNCVGLFKCDKCSRIFTVKQAMLNHRQRHKPDGSQKRHFCTICSYSTNYSSHLRQHMFTHSGERPYKCSHCEAGFIQNSLLKKHLLKHEKSGITKKDNDKTPKQLECSRCSKTFDNTFQLLKHIKIHKQKHKSHKCDLCNKKFSHESFLKKHKKRHVRKLDSDDSEESSGKKN